MSQCLQIPSHSAQIRSFCDVTVRKMLWHDSTPGKGWRSKQILDGSLTLMPPMRIPAPIAPIVHRGEAHSRAPNSFSPSWSRAQSARSQSRDRQRADNTRALTPAALSAKPMSTLRRGLSYGRKFSILRFIDILSPSCR